jgi:formylglycine-generating enzyme required for sulfatase activity
LALVGLLACFLLWATPVDCRQSKQSKSVITNSIGMKLALIKPGRFMMGSATDSQGHLDDELQHEVEITKPFYLGVYEVTIGQFRAFVRDTGFKTEAESDSDGGHGYDPVKKQWDGREPKKRFDWQNTGWEQTDGHPVVNVAWSDAKEFCDWLSQKEKKQYRLPTEAQWEYACRAGTQTRFYSGDKDSDLEKVANIADVSVKSKYRDISWAVSWNDKHPFTAPVGQFKPNTFGLFDMHGNVWEWCADWYDRRYYQKSPPKDPPGPSSSPEGKRVIRGGAWDTAARPCRAAHRGRRTPDFRDDSLGFRVAMTDEA